MTMETMPAARSNSLEPSLTNEGCKRDTVVIVGAGQNTAHMGDSLARLGKEHPVHVFEVGPPLIPVEPDKLHLTNTPEGRA